MGTQRKAGMKRQGQTCGARQGKGKVTKADDKQAGQPRLAKQVGCEPSEGEGNEPDYRTLFRQLVERANQGEPEALIRLRKFLDVNPSIWEQAGDLTTVAERAWTERIAGADRLAAESVKRRIARLKADLTGPHPTALENLQALRKETSRNQAACLSFLGYVNAACLLFGSGLRRRTMRWMALS